MGKTVVIELKNDMEIKGTLDSVDQFLNLKLTGIQVLNEERYPHMVSQMISNGVVVGEELLCAGLSGTLCTGAQGRS